MYVSERLHLICLFFFVVFGQQKRISAIFRTTFVIGKVWKIYKMNRNIGWYYLVGKKQYKRMSSRSKSERAASLKDRMKNYMFNILYK